MPKIQWLKSDRHYRKLILTICRFRKEGRNDLRWFCQSDLNTFNVPYATLQQHCPLGREQSYPDFQGPNGLLSSNEHANHVRYFGISIDILMVDYIALLL